MRQNQKSFASFLQKRRPFLLHWFFIAVIGLTHRAILLVRMRGFVKNLVAQQPDFLVMQLLPLDNYRQHFWRSLWLLQQTPPVDHLVMKAVVMLAPGPYAMALLLSALSGALTVATSCVLQVLIERVSGSRVLGFVLALWFMLSTDTLVLEYVFFGQIFYEQLGMLCVTACCALLVRMGGKQAVWRAAAIGLVAAMAALSRSSLSYFPVAIVVFAMLRWRRREAIACLVPILLLNGGWAAKNAFVYGKFSLETSSWGGMNAERGIDWTQQRPLLCHDIAQAPAGTYPDWFLKINRECPTPFWAVSEANATAKTQALDSAAQTSLGGVATIWNSRAVADLARQYHRAVDRFIVAHPRLAWVRFEAGYEILWQRMADYGAMYFDPVYIVPVHYPFPGVLTRSFREKRRVMLTISHDWHAANRPATFGTISLAPLDAVSIVAVHFVFPLLLCVDIFRRWRGQATFLPRGSAALAVVVAYGLVMFSAFDVAENMRFRLSIEPAIIALTAACSTGVWRLISAIRPLGAMAWIFPRAQE